MHRYARYVPGFLIGALAVLIAAWSFGLLPAEINYCYEDQTNKDCPVHYVALVALWQITKILNWVSPAFGAAATVAIAIFTRTLYVVTRDQLTHNRRVECAYIKISPRSPGVMFGHHGRIDVRVEVRNHGTTPARVTDMVLSASSPPDEKKMPDIPIYTREPDTIVPTAFLVANDWVSTSSWVTMPEEQANEIMRGNRRLFVFGYVDYIDQFDERHRAGFGRRYEKTLEGDTNLIFMTEPGYNYDRPRERNEGNDWN